MLELTPDRIVRSNHSSIDPTSFYLTSLSSNTPEIIVHDIRSQVAEHPATGLHKAELYIYSLSQAIRVSIESINTDRLKILGYNRDAVRLDWYRDCQLGWLYWLTTRKYLDLEIELLRGRIQSGMMAVADAAPLLEDAQIELTAAMNEREKILHHYPHLNTDKQQVMKTTGRARLTAKLMANQSKMSGIGATEGIPELPPN